MAKFKGVELICSVCSNMFKVSPSRANTAKTCSKECADKVRFESRIKPLVKLCCELCGKFFLSPPSHASRRKCCSRECANKCRASESYVGEKNGFWKGGKSTHAAGYIYIRMIDHPFSSGGYIFEHRYIMEQWLKINEPDSMFLTEINGVKYLSSEVVVHHKDGNKAFNSIHNLECMTKSEHATHHNQERREITIQANACGV